MRLPRCNPSFRRGPPGFTLIELMIALAVVAILVAVAYPSYQSAVQKGRRADGMAALTTLMQAQERWRANHTAYQGTLSELPGASARSPDGHYDLAITADSATATGYVATATAREGSPQRGDAKCRVMRVTLANGVIAYASQNSAGTDNSGSPDPCWVK